MDESHLDNVVKEESDEDENSERLDYLIRAALQDESMKGQLLAVSKSNAQRVLDEMWKVRIEIVEIVLPPTLSRLAQMLELPAIPCDPAHIQSYASRNKLRRFSLKIALKYDKLPTTLFLKGVVCTDLESRGIGGFADVFYGSFGELVVAIKRPRVYIAASETQRTKIWQAFCRESLLWKNLDHKHILPFLGVSDDVFRHRTISMILPWMTKGSIKHYIDSLQRGGQLDGKQFQESVAEWVCRRIILPTVPFIVSTLSVVSDRSRAILPA